ncbi:cellulose synthase/poly-beta-1,6-N-acetylglucosamine synthase-like glycosyltransferase [Alkalibacillus salilacus]|uniref:Cellulose synthase/poly-beta-1,6-N-acetylglucosamine synthase-like glycosyltransferase n=1 Tax=Alkalibacillus salilacus TaxID=284582 RepID=A0ABT9VIQ0_9BACI|nr:cellulose synthase/poly-beta-1,6-N-acetylglucosamine synthase-like glycosyltransferase [Alkalibacillus salilacus]
MYIILVFIVFPAISLLAGILVYLKSKIWWLTPLTTMLINFVFYFIFYWYVYESISFFNALEATFNYFTLPFFLVVTLTVYVHAKSNLANE